MNNNIFKEQLNKYLVGQELVQALSVLPTYNNKAVEVPDRLLALLDIYKVYIPTENTIKIYNTLYGAVISSLDKKCSILETNLLNNNFYQARGFKRYGVIGGLDSFKITGGAGLGKTSSIQRCSEIISNGVLINEKPIREIVPILFVECPADSSFKSLMYSILQAVDYQLGTKYFEANNKSTATADSLLVAVVNVLINHVAVLVIDEIERTASKKGEQLLNYLTALINQSNVSICFVGNEVANNSFKTKEYMGRRTIGLSMSKMKYDEYFYNFLEVLFNYQYTKNKVSFDPEYARTIYKLTNGIPAIVVSLFVEAQRKAILNGVEKLDIKVFEEVFNEQFSNFIPFIEYEPVKHSDYEIRQSVSETVEVRQIDNIFINIGRGVNMETKQVISGLSSSLNIEFIVV